MTEVMGSDPRIGPAFLAAGLGYGGYCFPKDVAAFERLAERLGYPFPMLADVARINDEAVHAVLERLRGEVRELSGSRVAVLGLSFKPETDDVRLSPALALASRLLQARGGGGRVRSPSGSERQGRAPGARDRDRSVSPPAGGSTARHASTPSCAGKGCGIRAGASRG